MLNAAAGTRGPGQPRCCSRPSAPPLDVAALTGGLVDPTVGATLRLAGYDRTLRRDPAARRARSSGRPSRPSPAGVDQASTRAAGRSALPAAPSSISARPRRRSPPTGPRSPLRRRPGRGVLVSLGGDVSVAGDPPEGGWPIRIADDHAAPARRARADGRDLERRSRQLGHARAPLDDCGRRAPPHHRPAHGATGGHALADRQRRRRARACTRTRRARPRSCSARRRPPGWSRAACRRGSPPRTGPS